MLKWGIDIEESELVKLQAMVPRVSELSFHEGGILMGDDAPNFWYLPERHLNASTPNVRDS